ncbi:MAG: MFS transporter [Proteobacteria bacterium]|nr:MFS transporter [Pseudomonadota bacterium]
MTAEAVLDREAAPHAPGAQSPATPVTRRVVMAAVAGNALEFYDFGSYAFFAVYIGKTFFPATNPFASLMLALAVFGVGFVSRPLGGIFIGAYADRAGRRPAMLLTIALMTLGTLGLALTPSYDSIGLAAPIIMVICRLVQGLALGGEVGPSTAFLIEIAPPGKRGLYASWQLASQGAASLIAGLVGMGLTSTLAPAELQAWGWRVPFVFGLLIIPLAIYLRRALPETLGHVSRVKGTAPVPPVRLRSYSRLIFLAVLVVIGATVSTYLGMYMTTYAIATLKLPPTVAMSATVAVGLVTLLFALVGGWLADRYNRKSVMLIPRILLALLVVPAFMFLIDARTTAALIGVTTFLAALTAMSAAASLVAVPELLPASIRATGLAIAYAVGVALFGGSTQLIVTWLIEFTGNPAAPAWYVVGTSIITALAILALPEGRDRALEA